MTHCLHYFFITIIIIFLLKKDCKYDKQQRQQQQGKSIYKIGANMQQQQTSKRQTKVRKR